MKVVALEKSLLVIRKILSLFVNTLIVDQQHYLLNTDNLTQPIQIQLYQKRATSCEPFFLDFQNLYYILNICQKKMTLIADVFLEIPAPKNMVR